MGCPATHSNSCRFNLFIQLKDVCCFLIVDGIEFCRLIFKYKDKAAIAHLVYTNIVRGGKSSKLNMIYMHIWSMLFNDLVEELQ